jgi:hypothetical protein
VLFEALFDATAARLNGAAKRLDIVPASGPERAGLGQRSGSAQTDNKENKNNSHYFILLDIQNRVRTLNIHGYQRSALTSECRDYASFFFEQAGKRRLAHLQRLKTQVLTVKLDKVEGPHEDARVMVPGAEEIEG